MKTMVLHRTCDVAHNPLQLEDRPVPPLQTGHVLVKIHVCGVCRTDLHVVEGELADIKLPLIPGHEISGEIVELRAGAVRYALGQRVGVPSRVARARPGHTAFSTRRPSSAAG